MNSSSTNGRPLQSRPSQRIGTGGSSKSSKNEPDDLVAAFINIGILFATGAGMSWFSRWLAQQFFNNQNTSIEDMKTSKTSQSRLAKLLQRRGINDMPSLTHHEALMAQDVLDPSDINIRFADIGGIDTMKQEIWELAVLPLQRPDLFKCNKSKLLSEPAGGILLYGPPGTGKTMLAKAIAKEANATFLTIKLSKIMSKWFGESNKLIDATFSLAKKLSPSIIFIDELDTFLNPRDGGSENGAGNAIKAEFLTLWDGIETSDDVNILVLGATNRPNHVDGAILRRLPRSFRISLPNESGRLQILNLTLDTHPIDKSAKQFIPLLAKQTIGYSGSDIKELCKCAALEALRELIKETSHRAVHSKVPQETEEENKDDNNNNNNKNNDKKETPKVRPMSRKDLEVAMKKVKRTGQDAWEYERSQFFDNHHDPKNGKQKKSNQKRRSTTRGGGGGRPQPSGGLQGLLALSQLLSEHLIHPSHDDDDDDHEFYDADEQDDGEKKDNGNNNNDKDDNGMDDIPEIM